MNNVGESLWHHVPMQNHSFLSRWCATWTRASKAYWATQVFILVFSVVAGAAFVERIQADRVMPAWTFMLRAALDGLLFILMTHLFVRPLLRLRFLSTQTLVRDWFGLVLWLSVVAALAVWASMAIDHLKIVNIGTVTSVRFEAGAEQLRLQLTGPKLYAVAWLNTLLSYAMWCALYLGVVSLAARRRLQEQVREAKLQQLTLQLNPHFLFNAFNTIRGSIFEDQQRAADLVTKLAELFRFHLSMSKRISQSLQEEWQLAEQYLAIEQARLDDRLRVKIDLEPRCLGYALPCLALLSLIENAIKHGIATDVHGGTLHISAREEGARWVLEVSNSVPVRHISAAGTGTGLNNLRERIALRYGNRAQVEVLREPYAHAVQLWLPKE